ncbi:DNA mismatch repair protein MLH3 [Dendrobium catenatum]|uniref:DNA mismatch repair protein MLH3 n=1 Tax=Dendrobium catenatum TaxID=906689 RepID=A0A2I0WBM5_9ASPA|nr:DNA mismatch repair protein MLH3 [Dendrobium catenatum]
MHDSLVSSIGFIAFAPLDSGWLLVFCAWDPFPSGLLGSVRLLLRLPRLPLRFLGLGFIFRSTSKVHLVADAGTGAEALGFRGEALSSISDVSLLEIRSKARGKPNAYCKIIKSSKCLFFGIDDQREDVGTTVSINCFAQLLAGLLCLWLVMVLEMRFLVHSEKLFTLIENLPFLGTCQGQQMHSRQSFNIVSFTVSDINARFVCKGPIHNLINSIATNFHSTTAKKRDSSENHCRKRQKTQGYPAYLLNLCCPMSSYDLTFEPSKTIVEFKDWGTVLSFFEQAIIPYWERFASNVFQAEGASCEASFQESGPLREDLFSEGITKKSDIKSMKDSSNFFEGLGSRFQISNPLVTSFGYASNYQKHNRLSDDEADYVSCPKRFHSNDDLVELCNSLFQHEDNILMGTSTNGKHSRRMNCKRYAPCEIVGDIYYSPIACNGSVKTYAPMENDLVNSTCCSSSCVFGEHHEFLNEPFSVKEECTLGENQYSSCLHCSDNLIFKKNISDCLLQERSDSQSPVVGVIRKCQKLTQQSCFEICPSFCDHACLSETSLSHQNFEYVDADSEWGFSHFGFTDPSIVRTPPRHHEIVCDSTLIENHCAIEETNAKFLESVLNESRELPPDLCFTGRTVVDHKFCPSSIKHLQHDYLLDQFTSTKGGSASILKEEKGCLLSVSSSIEHTDIYNTSLHNSVTQNYDEAAESPSKNNEFQNSLFSDVRELRSRRSHSAPPFYKGKKKFPILNCLLTDHVRENSKMMSSYCIDEPGLNCQLEPYSASQPCMKPITELKKPCLWELNYDKSNHSNLIEIQASEEFDNGYEPDEIDPASSSLTKWRTDCLQPAFNHDGAMPHKVDVLDISSGLLHLSGSSLVPASINKDCFDNARVLLQLDRKFIPVVASGILLIIDQNTRTYIHMQPVHSADPSTYSHYIPLTFPSAAVRTPSAVLGPQSKTSPFLAYLDPVWRSGAAAGGLLGSRTAVSAAGILLDMDPLFQHAADERIRLEDLRKKVLHGELQSSTYLNPEHELILPEMGYQLLQKYAEQIKKWGWICNIQSQFSDSFTWGMDFLRQHECRATLVAVPHILGTDLTGKDLLEYIEQLVETDGSSIIPPAVLRVLNYKACRGAIMFGDALLPSECSLIVEELKATSLCFQCAHGRPTTVPLLNMVALHEQLSRLDMPMPGRSDEWHGLRRHSPSIHRARQRLESCKRFLHG